MSIGNSGSVGKGKMDVGQEMANGQAAAPKKEEQVVISAEVLLAQLVNVVGENFVVIPTSGWQAIVQTLMGIDENEEKPESIVKIMENLGIPVVPVSLSKKEEPSPILMPDDVPEGEGRIIMP